MDLYHFFRVSALGATLTLPLIGAGSVDRRLSARRAAGLMAVAAAFHAFAYVHNDLCDLELDRTQPRRQMYPLVAGRISPRAARAVALACLPLTFALDALLVGTGRPGDRGTTSSTLPRSHAPTLHLAAALALLAAYNRWGKVCPLPPLTDLIQGVGWAALLRYGAVAAGGAPSALTRLLGAYEVLLILMVNGVHGALRDLENDGARGAHTTALLLGATAGEGGGVRASPALLAYAGALQAALLALPAAGAARNLAGYDRPERAAAAAGLAAVAAGTVAALAAAARGEEPDAPAMAHLVLLLSAPVALVAPGLAPPARAALLAAHLLPPLTNGLGREALRWALGLRPRRSP
jgi:4-hydroxybenzoate polyprenyltransferase